MMEADAIEYVHQQGIAMAHALRNAFPFCNRDKSVIAGSINFHSLVQTHHLQYPPELIPGLLYFSKIWDTLRTAPQTVCQTQVLVCVYHLHNSPLRNLLSPVPPPASLSIPGITSPPQHHHVMHNFASSSMFNQSSFLPQMPHQAAPSLLPSPPVPPAAPYNQTVPVTVAHTPAPSLPPPLDNDDHQQHSVKITKKDAKKKLDDIVVVDIAASEEENDKEEEDDSINFFSGQTLHKKDPMATSALKAMLNIENPRKQKKKGSKPLVERRLDIDPDVFAKFDDAWLASVEAKTSTEISRQSPSFFIVRGKTAAIVSKATNVVLEFEKQLRKNASDDGIEEEEELIVLSKRQFESKEQVKAVIKDHCDERSVALLMSLKLADVLDVMERFETKKSTVKNISAWLHKTCQRIQKSERKKKKTKKIVTTLPEPENDPLPLPHDLPDLDIMTEEEVTGSGSSSSMWSDKPSSSPFTPWS